MRKTTHLATLSLMLIMPAAAMQTAMAQTATTRIGQQTGKHQLSVTVSDKESKESVIMATVQLEPLGAATVTNAEGRAVITNVPEGAYRLKVTYVGYEEYSTVVNVGKDLQMDVRLTPTSLKLGEVTVTAKQNASGTSTSSIIGRQAIDHLQATSLADIMQLVPGQIIRNTDLTQQSRMQIRMASDNVANYTSSVGTSVVVDGVPLSSNAEVTQGGFSSTAFAGTDLRRIAADDIDQVEVIRGIPSAEYGDLTSGMVVVRSKVGVTPLQVKAKITPELQNYSASKGFRTKSAGVINASLDYAKAWGDPRWKTRSYGRYTGSLGWGYDWSSIWHTDTKLRLTYGRQWSGQDPDAIADGTENKSTNTTLALNHNGRINLNKPLARSLRYTVGLSLGWQDTENTAYVGGATTDILTARETGYYAVPWVYGSYLATGLTESRPASLYFKVSDSFYAKLGKTRQTFKVGMDYRYDWNSGRGYYNANDSLPYRPNSDGRPRAFSDIPGYNQLAFYAEDNLMWRINKVNMLRVQGGLRLQMAQPFSNLATTALSPRLNASFTAAKWLDIRAGIGMSSKAPGLNILYPDRKYSDIAVASYMPQDDQAAQLRLYHTYAADVPQNENIKNATTTKAEVGFDVKTKWGGKFSVMGYHERTRNGFGALSQFTVYDVSRFDQTHGLIITPGQATQVDYSNPLRTDRVFTTTGMVGNTQEAENEGVELDFNFGTIKPLNTTVMLSGAYSRTKTWNTNLNTSGVRNSLLTSYYTTYGLTPFRVVYPSGEDYDEYRQWVNTLRVVTNIPRLRMVVSLTAQAIWAQWNQSWVSDKQATGWITSDLTQHAITSDMQGGYIGYDGAYYATAPQTTGYVAIADLAQTYQNNGFTKQPQTWNMSLRLTKEFGSVGQLSLYVNNAIYHEPYLTTNLSESLTQRNTSSFAYGIELSLKL